MAYSASAEVAAVDRLDGRPAALEDLGRRSAGSSRAARRGSTAGSGGPTRRWMRSTISISMRGPSSKGSPMYHDRYARLGPRRPVEGDVGPHPRRRALAGQPVARLPGEVAEQHVGLEPLLERQPVEEGVLEGVPQRTDGVGEDVVEHQRTVAGRRRHERGGDATMPDSLWRRVAMRRPGWTASLTRPSGGPQRLGEGVEVGDGAGEPEEAGRAVAVGLGGAEQLEDRLAERGRTTGTASKPYCAASTSRVRRSSTPSEPRVGDGAFGVGRERRRRGRSTSDAVGVLGRLAAPAGRSPSVASPSTSVGAGGQPPQRPRRIRLPAVPADQPDPHRARPGTCRRGRR